MTDRSESPGHASSPDAAYAALVERISDVLEGRAGVSRLSGMMDDMPAIFEGVGRGLEAEDGAMLVVDRTGRVISRNGAAARRLDLAVSDNIAAAALAPRPHHRTLEAIAASSEPGALLLADSAGRPVLMVGVSPERGGDILLAECRLGRSPALDARLVEAFGLTPSELRSLTALMDGRSVDAIAEASGRTLGTVRQIVKAILAKMGVHSQAQAVALAFSLAVTTERMGESALRPTPPLADALLEATPDGPVPVHRFGKPGGYPVLLIHGALFGILAQPEVRHAARVLGLDVIAPIRPGYGTAPLAADGDPLPLATAQAAQVLERLGLKRVVVIGHDIGTRFAVAFAIRHPERTAGLVCAPTTPPMRDWSQTAGMPLKHRVNAWASQKMPVLMDKIVALGLAQVAKKGVELVPRLVFSDCDHDRETWQAPRFAPSLQECFSLIAGQTGLGFRHEMRLTNEDWSALAPAVSCPCVLLHGEKSETVSGEAVAHLARLLPRAHLVPVADGGHTLPLTHPELIFRQALILAAREGLSETT